MTQKQITALRKFFRISTAAMVFANEVSRSYGGPGLDEKGLAMMTLHKEALSELEKEIQDAGVICRLFNQMETLSVQSVPKFPPGGISDGWLPNDISPTAGVISREENENL